SEANPATPPLQPETLRAIAATGVTRAFPRNTVLINEGDVGDSLYIVLTGRVKVFASNEAGREFVIDFHAPGEYVGEMSLDGARLEASRDMNGRLMKDLISGGYLAVEDRTITVLMKLHTGW